MAICVVWVSGAAAQPQPNKDFCDSSGTNLLFAIDTTTPYDDKDKELLIRAVGQMFEILHGGERLVIRTITIAFRRAIASLSVAFPVARRVDGSTI